MNARPSALTRRFAELGFLFGKLSPTKRAVFNIVKKKRCLPPSPFVLNIYDEICLHTQPSQTHPCPYHMFHLFHGPEITMKQVFQDNFSPILELHKNFNMGLTPPPFLNKIKKCVFFIVLGGFPYY